MLLFFIAQTSLMAAPAIWSIRDYKNTNVANYKKHPVLKQKINIANIDYQALNAAIYFETNVHRKNAGLKSLEHNHLLEKAAFNHSRDMVINNYFGHFTKSNGFDPVKRMQLLNIKNPKPAENIALNFVIDLDTSKEFYVIGKGKFSYSSTGKPLIPTRTYLQLAGAILDQWMKSPKHKKNILADKAIQLGCGAFMFIDSNQNDIPVIKATQDFQWFHKIKTR